jgi:hypothetical protein
MDFEAPIPGMSLTGAPGKYAWERPPEIVDPEDALVLHLERLSTKDKIEDITDILELGVDVKTLTEGLLRSAVAEGIHTIDVSMIIAPVIHEFIKDTAERMGIDFDEGFEDEEEKKKREPILNLRSAREAKKFLEKNKKKLPDDDLSSLALDEESLTEPEMEEPEEDMGLMARRPR